MRLPLGLLVLSSALLAQDVAFTNLGSTLAGIGKGDASRARLSQKLADDMFAVASRDHQPTSVLVTGFAEELTAALYGKTLSNRSLRELQESIRDVLRGPGATFHSAATLRQVLTRASADETKAQLITRRFMAIGEELRGPDDVIIKTPENFLRRK